MKAQPRLHPFLLVPCALLAVIGCPPPRGPGDRPGPDLGTSASASASASAARSESGGSGWTKTDDKPDDPAKYKCKTLDECMAAPPKPTATETTIVTTATATATATTRASASASASTRTTTTSSPIFKPSPERCPPGTEVCL